jgi:glutaredoxin-like protein DUF836
MCHYRRTGPACPRTGDRRFGLVRGDLRRALALVRRRTHRGSPVTVRLLEKADCGLCAEAHRALRRIALDLPLEIDRVDITRDSRMFDRYALRIPVVAVGERELDAAGLDDRAIAAWLRA